MTTERKIEANRKNAQRSTGPRSPAGKSKVTLNALRHGLTGRRILLPHEDPDEFDAFATKHRDALAPVGAREEWFVDVIVNDTWRLERVQSIEAALYVRATHEDLTGQTRDCRPRPASLRDSRC